MSTTYKPQEEHVITDEKPEVLRNGIDILGKDGAYLYISAGIYNPHLTLWDSKNDVWLENSVYDGFLLGLLREIQSIPLLKAEITALNKTIVLCRDIELRIVETEEK